MARRRLARHLKNSTIHLYVLFGLTTFFFGIIAAFMITQVLAQTADTNQIYSCVNNVNGEMRMVDSQTTCKNNEKSVKWSIQGPPGPPGPAGDTGGLNQYFGLPFFCHSCFLADMGDRFAEKDFTKARISSSIFTGADMHGVKFTGAFLTSNRFIDTNLEGADFSEVTELVGWGYPQNNNFTNSNLKNANFSNSILHEFNFTNADLENANFSGALLRSTKFNGAQNLSTANFDGATWENATCPDGTNSNNNGSTCAGHF